MSKNVTGKAICSLIVDKEVAIEAVLMTIEICAEELDEMSKEVQNTTPTSADSVFALLVLNRAAARLRNMKQKLAEYYREIR